MFRVEIRDTEGNTFYFEYEGTYMDCVSWTSNLRDVIRQAENVESEIRIYQDGTYLTTIKL